MLSSLQERVAEIVAALDEAKGFALAGGAALIARGDVGRQTRDLDFFGLTVDAVDRLAPAVRRALSAAGLTVGHARVSPGFARFIVADGDERTELDLAADARLLPAEPGRIAPTLSGEELAVDKVLALSGRAEARDFVDLMVLEPRYGLERLCGLAAEKDPDFEPALFAEVLARLDRLRRDEFELADAEYERLRGEVARWRERTIELRRAREPDHGREP